MVKVIQHWPNSHRKSPNSREDGHDRHRISTCRPKSVGLALDSAKFATRGSKSHQGGSGSPEIGQSPFRVDQFRQNVVETAPHILSNWPKLAKLALSSFNWTGRCPNADRGSHNFNQLPTGFPTALEKDRFIAKFALLARGHCVKKQHSDNSTLSPSPGKLAPQCWPAPQDSRSASPQKRGIGGKNTR